MHASQRLHRWSPGMRTEPNIAQKASYTFNSSMLAHGRLYLPCLLFLNSFELFFTFFSVQVQIKPRVSPCIFLCLTGTGKDTAKVVIDDAWSTHSSTVEKYKSFALRCQAAVTSASTGLPLKRKKHVYKIIYQFKWHKLYLCLYWQILPGVRPTVFNQQQ